MKNKLVCYFNLAMDMVRCGIREFVGDMAGPEFLKRELVEFGVDKYC